MKEQADQYSRDLHRNTQKTDRNAVILAVVLLIQTWGLALIERNYQKIEDRGCDRIGLLK